MDFICNFPFFSIVLCLLSAVVCSVLSGRAARKLTLIVEFILVCLAVSVLVYTVRTDGSFNYAMGHVGAPWGNELRIGVLEALMATAFMIVMFASVLGGGTYIVRDITEKKRNLYYILLNLMGAALSALVYTNDIFTGYVFLEILTLTSGGILMIKSTGKTTLAATRYLIINLLGSGLFLLGVILMYDLTGHLLMEFMHGSVVKLEAAGQYAMPLRVTTGLICAGLSIKSGLFPFHRWMPDTYGNATPTSASLLSGVVSKGYIFLLIKILYRVIGTASPAVGAAQNVLFVFGLCGIIMGSVSALRQESVNRMIAYSSAAQIGYIFVGIGLGGHMGFCAAIFHILTHAVTKPLLFLSAAKLTEASGGSPVFSNLTGASKRAPFSAVMFTIGALSMVGFPAFAGFVSKMFFSVAAVTHSSVQSIVTLCVLAVSTLLNAYYFFRTVIRIYTPSEDASPLVYKDWGFMASSAFFLILNLIFGLGSQMIYRIIMSGLRMLA